MQMKFLLGLALVTSLVIQNNCYAGDEEDFTEAAGKTRHTKKVDYYGKSGESFSTSFGTVYRAKNRLEVEESTGISHVVGNGEQLVFPKSSTLGEITLKKRLLLSQAMPREEMIQALAAFME